MCKVIHFIINVIAKDLKYSTCPSGGYIHTTECNAVVKCIVKKRKIVRNSLYMNMEITFRKKE